MTPLKNKYILARFLFLLHKLLFAVVESLYGLHIGSRLGALHLEVQG